MVMMIEIQLQILKMLKKAILVLRGLSGSSGLFCLPG